MAGRNERDKFGDKKPQNFVIKQKTFECAVSTNKLSFLKKLTRVAMRPPLNLRI